MNSHSAYHEPLALIIISSISIGIAAIAALWIAIDIVLRRGWRSMMAVMIPVYVVNALYLWPITLWTYLNYGRPPKPQKKNEMPSKTTDDKSDEEAQTTTQPSCHSKPKKEEPPSHSCHSAAKPETKSSPADSPAGHAGHEGHGGHDDHAGHMSEKEDASGGGHCHNHGQERPMFATITVAVCHCGAGCVLGDIVGEWLVYGAGITINGEMLWAEYLIDFAFAIAFGIVFQYYSIAPMSGDYSIKTLWRAAKADFFSLVFFEVGLFSWMAIFQIAIFNYRLPMNTVTYWWMMQISMFFGHWTGIPINWWLIKTGVKEPCA